MSVIDDVLAVLQADVTLAGLLVGGMYAESQLTRQSTPAAFDAAGEIRPSLVVNAESDMPFGPYGEAGLVSSRVILRIFFYQRTGYDVINVAKDRVIDLLHLAKIGSATWEIEWITDGLDSLDAATNMAMVLSRYRITRLR